MWPPRCCMPAKLMDRPCIELHEFAVASAKARNGKMIANLMGWGLTVFLPELVESVQVNRSYPKVEYHRGLPWPIARENDF